MFNGKKQVIAVFSMVFFFMIVSIYLQILARYTQCPVPYPLDHFKRIKMQSFKYSPCIS